MAQRERAAAVGQRLMDGEVETIVALFHLRPVEWTGPTLGAHAAAPRALPCGVLRPLMEEQQLDPRVGSRFERVRPARRRAPAATRLLAPALGRFSLLLGVPCLEDRPCRL